MVLFVPCILVKCFGTTHINIYMQTERVRVGEGGRGMHTQVPSGRTQRRIVQTASDALSVTYSLIFFLTIHQLFINFFLNNDRTLCEHIQSKRTKRNSKAVSPAYPISVPSSSVRPSNIDTSRSSSEYRLSGGKFSICIRLSGMESIGSMRARFGSGSSGLSFLPWFRNVVRVTSFPAQW